MYGDVNVNVEDGNLGRSSSTGSGVQFKIGISNIENTTPILITGSMDAKKIKEKVGNTPLADACIDSVENGALSNLLHPGSRQPQTGPSGKSRQSRQEREPSK